MLCVLFFLTFLSFFICLLLLYWLSHVRLFVNLWTVVHQAPLSMGFPRPKKRKARFWERVHGQRPLRTQGWKGLPGGDEGQKTLGLREVWEGTMAPRPGRGHCPTPICLPSVCPAPHLPGALGSRLSYFLSSRHSCLLARVWEGWSALNDLLQLWKVGLRGWG